MSLRTFNKKFIVRSKRNFDEFSDMFITSLSRHLNDQSYFCCKANNKISFKKSFDSTTHTGKNLRNAIVLLRSGEVEIEDQKDKFKITVKVKLNTILFFVIVGSLLFSLALLPGYNFNFKIFPISLLGFIVILSIILTICIVSKINRLINFHIDLINY